MVKQAWEEPVRGKRSRGRQLKRWKDKLSDRFEELGLREYIYVGCKGQTEMEEGNHGH